MSREIQPAEGAKTGPVLLLERVYPPLLLLEGSHAHLVPQRSTKVFFHFFEGFDTLLWGIDKLAKCSRIRQHLGNGGVDGPVSIIVSYRGMHQCQPPTSAVRNPLSPELCTGYYCCSSHSFV